MELWLVGFDVSGVLQEPGSVLLALGGCAGLTQAVLLVLLCQQLDQLQFLAIASPPLLVPHYWKFTTPQLAAL